MKSDLKTYLLGTDSYTWEIVGKNRQVGAQQVYHIRQEALAAIRDYLSYKLPYDELK